MILDFSTVKPIFCFDVLPVIIYKGNVDLSGVFPEALDTHWLDSKQGMNFASICHMFRFSVKILWHDPSKVFIP
jgi:hypothetical protein